MRRVSAVLVAQAATVLAADNGAHGVRMIVDLLQTMSTELTESSEADAETHQKTQCWCKKAIAELEASATENKEISESEAARARSAAGAVEKFTKQMKEDSERREEEVKALADAQMLRNKENDEFREQNGFLVETIESTKKAIEKLSGVAPKGEKGSFLQSSSLAKYDLEFVQNTLKQNMNLSVSGKFMPSAEQKKVLNAFFQEGLTPGAGPYESKSGMIVGVLKEMADQFEADLGTAHKTEQDSLAQFSKLKKLKTDLIAQLAKDIQRLSQKIAKNKAIASDSSNKSDVHGKAYEADSAAFGSSKEHCATQEKAYSERTVARASEQEAVNKAIDVLNSDEARVLFDKVQNDKKKAIEGSDAMSFIQTSESMSKKQISENRKKAAKVLFSQFQKSKNSKVLALMATVESASIFTKVIATIDELVAELDTKLKEDTTNKDSCTEVIMTRKQEVQTETNEVTKQTQLSDAANAEIDRKTKAIEEKVKEIQDRRDELSEMSNIRREENAEYIRDAANNQAAAETLAQAISVLQTAYKSDAVAPQFIQVSASESKDNADAIDQQAVNDISKADEFAANKPPAFEKYEAKAGGSAISALEALKNDSENAMKLGLKEEEAAAQRYGQTVAQFGRAIAECQDDKASLTADKVSAEKDLATATADLKTAERELKSLTMALEGKQKECAFILNNYGQRQSSFNQEKSALLAAKGYLQNTATPTGA